MSVDIAVQDEIVSALDLDEEWAAVRALGSDALYEVIGETIKEKNVGAFEVYASFLLARLLSDYVETRELGQVVHEMLFDFRPTLDRRRSPDAAFVSAERWPAGETPPNKASWKVVPDLAVEVVSPTDSLRDVLEKVEEYFQVGVRLVWLVVPNVEKVYVYESPTAVRIVSIDENLDGGTVVPGFQMPLRKLFKKGTPA